MKLGQMISVKLTKKRQAWFFLVLGPALIATSMVVLLLGTSSLLAVLAFLTCCGAVLSWKYALKGALASVGTMLFVFLACVAFSDRAFISWELFGLLSMSVALFVVGLSALEYRQTEQELDLEAEAKVSGTKQYYEGQLTLILDEQSELKDSLQDKHEKLEALEEDVKIQQKLQRSLKQECDHYLIKAERLVEESLEFQRKLHGQESLRLELEDMTKTYRKTVAELNTFRVEWYQQRLLLDHAQEQGLLATAPTQEIMPPDALPVDMTEIKVLEEERGSLKKYYKQQIRDYKGLQEKIKGLFSAENITEEKEGLDTYCEELTTTFHEMTRNLQETRIEIFKTEGNLIELRKNLKAVDQTTIVPKNYLAIADQECLRLEEENTMLLDLLGSLFQVIEKKHS